MTKIIVTFKYIFFNINKALKIKLFFLFSIMLLAALMEVGSIASLIPFLQNVLFLETSKEIMVFDNLFNNFEIYNKYRFSFITVFFISFILLSLIVRLYLLKLMFKFTKELGYFFATQIFCYITDYRNFYAY